jgi:hypothetical protein
LQIPQFITWAKNDGDLDSLREHPRYAALVAHVVRQCGQPVAG